MRNKNHNVKKVKKSVRTFYASHTVTKKDRLINILTVYCFLLRFTQNFVGLSLLSLALSIGYFFYLLIFFIF